MPEAPASDSTGPDAGPAADAGPEEHRAEASEPPRPERIRPAPPAGHPPPPPAGGHPDDIPPRAQPWEEWPEALAWRRLAPEFSAVILIGTAITWVVVAAAATVATVIWLEPVWLAGVLPAVALAAAFRMVIRWRWSKSWRWVERDRDVVVKHGRFFRKLTIVPYGRIQFVDLEAGPIDRIFGLTGLKIHTAASGETAEMPGLAPADAAALRDRLAEKAAEVREGL